MSASACLFSLRLPAVSLWWAHVTVTPEASRTAVLRRGTENGLIGVTPEGGHVDPSSMVGDSLLWKNAQKKAKKNSTSDVINRIIPHRSPIVTDFVWCPIILPSRETSRHHCIMVNRVIIVPMIRGIAENL